MKSIIRVRKLVATIAKDFSRIHVSPTFIHIADCEDNVSLQLFTRFFISTIYIIFSFH